MEDKSPDLGAKINEYYNYNNPNFLDSYSDNIGAHEVLDRTVFKVKGLKRNFNRRYNPWAKKHFYRISFYNTNGSADTTAISSTVISTNSSGVLNWGKILEEQAMNLDRNKLICEIIQRF